MKTAREWFEKLRPDLRYRAIKASKNHPAVPLCNLNTRYYSMSDALYFSFNWSREISELSTNYSHDYWMNIYEEAIAIEQGRKPDIKPKKK